LKITALVENYSKCELKAKHGLSFLIQTENHKVLFDLGPDETLFMNAKKKGVDLSEIDTVVISHGHLDHGGALRSFLRINKKAKVYVQRQAFERHYCKLFVLMADVGLDRKLINNSQITLVDGDFVIDEELSLFTVDNNSYCYSNANDPLYEGKHKDSFMHEQNLVIREKSTAILVGCGHTGIVNIMQKAISYAPDACIGGYHLYNPLTKKTVDNTLLSQIADNLRKFPQVKFYTCHCTGMTAYDFLTARLPNMDYVYCGDTIDLEK